jgi:hypothetical protein
VKPSALRTELGNVAETQNGASKTPRENDDENRLKEQFISSQAFHQTPGGRVQEITVGEQFKLRNLELFDPVAQEQDRPLPATIHTQTEHTSSTRTKVELD